MNFRWFAAVLLLILVTGRSWGQSADDRYVQIYGLIQEADRLADAGEARPAVTKYLEAQVAVKTLQSSFPGWNAPLLAYRLEYISGRIEPLTRKAAETPAPVGPTPAEAAAASTARQLNALQTEIAQLAAQNSLLEAKFREALTVQPAAVDPRELAKAEERIKALQKERDLLAVTLEQAAGRPASGSSTTGAATTEAKQDVVTQTAVVSVLQRQNEELQKRINDLLVKLKPSARPTSEETLKLKESVAALEASNRVMKEEQVTMENRLVDFVKRHGSSAARDAELQRQLAEAQQAAKAAKEERDALVEKLNKVTKELTERDTRIRSTATQDLEKQLDTIRAKLKIFEAKKVPFTVEELAMFKQAPIKVARSETSAPPVLQLTTPATTVAPALPQTADALRAIDAGRFDEAERKYRELLAKDEKNVNLLNNLAAVQMDQDKVAEAEATLKKALEIDPQDAVSLYFMGGVKIRQEKYNEAFDVLSRSATIDPDKANTQFFLAQALIQQGNRGPAESALRRAIQLKPGWGEPHYMLAVLYATQEADTLGLAKYHYKQAVTGGVARNLELEKLLEKNAVK